MTFSQHAVGIFVIEVIGPNHCGPDDRSPREFHYEVDAEFSGSALDDRGFLIDNLMFQRYFDSLRSTELSCERLAQQSAQYFIASNSGCTSITVGLWGIPDHAKVSVKIDR